MFSLLPRCHGDLGSQKAPERPADNPEGDEVFAVYASPAGHPFCFGPTDTTKYPLCFYGTHGSVLVSLFPAFAGHGRRQR